MKNAFLKSLLLLLPLLALAGGLEMWLRRQPNFYAQKRGYLEAALSSTRVLILGASQANQGIRPDLLDKDCFNLGHVGQDLYYDAALAQAFTPRMPKLRLVILPLAYVTLEYRFPGTPEEWRTFCYGVHYGLANEIFRYNLDPRQYSLLALTEPLKALKQFFGCGGVGEYLDTRKDGFQSVAPIEDDMIGFIINEITSRKRVRYHHTVMRPENIPLNLSSIEGLAGLLKARGVALALITTPVFKEYAAALDQERWKGNQGRIRALAKRLGLWYRDYLEDDSFKRADFADVDHLNRDGAVKFTRMLKKDLAKAGLPDLTTK